MIRSPYRFSHSKLIKQIACKLKKWFYITIVLLFSVFMSYSNFFIHVPCECSTFPWLCGWYGRLFFDLIFNSSQRSVTTPNLRKIILTDLVESFFIAYTVNLTLNINTYFDKNLVQQNFSKSHHNLPENELRSLFVAKEGEAFSYPVSITNFVLVMQNFLVIFHYLKKFT